MSFIISEVKYGAIDTDDSSCNGYYIINFYSSPYILQAYLSIYGRVIPSGEIICEGTYFFTININYHYDVIQKTKFNNTMVSFRTIINGNVKLICHDSKNFVQQCLRYISQNDYNTLTPLQAKRSS